MADFTVAFTAASHRPAWFKSGTAQLCVEPHGAIRSIGFKFIQPQTEHAIDMDFTIETAPRLAHSSAGEVGDKVSQIVLIQM